MTKLPVWNLLLAAIVTMAAPAVMGVMMPGFETENTPQVLDVPPDDGGSPESSTLESINTQHLNLLDLAEPAIWYS